MKTSERHSQILNAFMGKGEGYRAPWGEETFGALHITEWEWGRVAADWDVNRKFDIGDGTIFGGLTAAMADSFLGLTAMTVLPENDDRFRTSHLRTDFLRPVVGPTVRLEGAVVNKSRHLIHVEMDINANGKRLIRAAATQVMRKAKPGMESSN